MTLDKEHAPALMQQAADEAVEDHVAFLRSWVADIRHHSGVSVDADRLEAIADAIATLTAERDAATTGERARIIAIIRKISKRFERGSASQNNHLALALALEEGRAG